jgi:hypothetical protein
MKSNAAFGPEFFSTSSVNLLTSAKVIKRTQGLRFGLMRNFASRSAKRCNGEACLTLICAIRSSREGRGMSNFLLDVCDYLGMLRQYAQCGMPDWVRFFALGNPFIMQLRIVRDGFAERHLT